MNIKLWLAVILCFSSIEIVYAQPLKFTIKGKIEGIVKGDTLRFSKINLEIRNSEKQDYFDVVVSNNNKFTYKGLHPHTQLYIMKYLPANGKDINSVSRTGVLILIDKGKTIVEGNRDNIYFASLSNHFYDKELKQIFNLSDSLDIERAKLIKLLNDNPKETEKYYSEYLSFYSNNKAAKRLDSMEYKYMNSVSNEYVASVWCEKTNLPVDSIEKRYNTFSEATKNSYYGKLLNTLISKIKSLNIGEPAPDFEVVTSKNERVTLSTFRGKYLLIYNFGMCPGSIGIDPYVIDTYRKHSDKFEILSITNNIDVLEDVGRKLDESDDKANKNSQAIKGMLSHTWRYEVTDNIYHSILFDKYFMQGLPYFIVISPDGKIVGRDFQEAFYALRKTLSSMK